VELSMQDKEVEVVALIWAVIHLYPGGKNVWWDQAGWQEK
jgi:hypothetical protein